MDGSRKIYHVYHVRQQGDEGDRTDEVSYMQSHNEEDIIEKDLSCSTTPETSHLYALIE